jgi:hypothetical protein
MTAALSGDGVSRPPCPRRGGHSIEGGRRDDSEAHTIRSQPIHGQRELVSARSQPERPLYRRRSTPGREDGAYWLLDTIAICQQHEEPVATEEFQVWKLTVREDRSATLVCDDGNDNIVYILFSCRLTCHTALVPSVLWCFCTRSIFAVSFILGGELWQPQ